MNDEEFKEKLKNLVWDHPDKKVKLQLLLRAMFVIEIDKHLHNEWIPTLEDHIMSASSDEQGALVVAFVQENMSEISKYFEDICRAPA